MLKTIALIGLAAALAFPSVPAFAVNGNSSSYGTEGSAPTVPTQSLTPFQRSWNHANESKERARAGAAWIRHHGGYGRHLAPRRSGLYLANATFITALRARSLKQRGEPDIGRNPCLKLLHSSALPPRSLFCPRRLLPNRAIRPSWGTVGWGPVIPTQSLTPRDREWNINNQALYRAQNSANWLRAHGKSPFPFFQ